MAQNIKITIRKNWHFTQGIELPYITTTKILSLDK